MQPSPPQVPSPPASPAPVIVATPQASLPVRPATAREVEALKARGSELSRQITSATERRNALARRLREVDPAARAGLEQRIQLLDQRILGIEDDIAENGRLLAQARPELLAQTGVPGPISAVARDVIAAGGSFTLFALLAVIVVRMVGRRRIAPSPVAARSPELESRLDRLEQGVEAVVLEVERIAEGQRFVTRLMTEGREPMALGVGQAPAEPIPIRRKEEAPLPHGER